MAFRKETKGLQRPVIAKTDSFVTRNAMRQFAFTLKNLQYFDRERGLARNLRMPQGPREIARFDRERRFIQGYVDKLLKYINLDRDDQEGFIMEQYFKLNKMFPGTGVDVVVDPEVVHDIEFQLTEMAKILTEEVNLGVKNG